MIEEKDRGAKKNVFGDELEVLRDTKTFLKREDVTIEECKDQIAKLQNSYDELLDQAKLITKVSDRLQNKINKANDELESKNIALQESLDALTKARLSRKANTITLIIVLILFLITEVILEPWIEDHPVFSNDKNDFSAIATALVAKLVIALSLRPIEKIVETRLWKRESERLKAKKKSTLEGFDESDKVISN